MSQLAIIGKVLNILATGLTIEEGVRSITSDGSKAISEREIPHLSKMIDYRNVPADLEMYVSEADQYIAQHHDELHDTILDSVYRESFMETFYMAHPDCKVHKFITNEYLNQYLDRLETTLKNGTTFYDLFISKNILKTQETVNNIKKTVDEIDYRQKNSETTFYRRMMESFTFERENHPSIRMMKPDPALFPKGLPEILSDKRYATEQDEHPRSIKDMILDSWKRKDRRHILLIGEGGIGKTVAMLTLPEENWFKIFKIPVVYVSLQRLDPFEGNLSQYIQEKTGGDFNHIIELANSIPDQHPHLLLLLDGFNEIPDKYKEKAEKYIWEWMQRPGIQIITTSRIGFCLENNFSKYLLQPLPYVTVKYFLQTADIKLEQLPQENDRIWRIINIPLMLVIYTQIEKAKEVTDRSSIALLLEWKEPENSAHIIWDYLQVELYRCVERYDTSHSCMRYAVAIFAIALYICCQMSHRTLINIRFEEFQALISDALSYYNGHKNLLSKQIQNVIQKYDPYEEENLLENSMVPEYARILVENIALFHKKEIYTKNSKNENVIYYSYSLMHQNFRDALASFFICSCLQKASDSKEKQTLLDFANFHVKNYIAENLSDEELKTLWENHQKFDPENGHITWILMELVGRQKNYDYRKLDFSGIDITKINVHSLLSKRRDICPLSANREYFNRSKISFESLSPNGHLDSVNCVMYSSDGRNLASGSYDNTVRIWNLESGESRILKGHSSYVYSVVYSPDSKHLASGSFDNTVRIWNLETGDCRVLEGHSERVTSVVFSPDGKHLASGSYDHTVRIWDLESGKSRALKGHSLWVTSVVFSPDGKHLASGSYDHTVRIWNLDSGDCCVLDDHSGWGFSLAYSPNGKQLAIGSSENTVRIWNLESGDCRLLEGHSDWVLSVAFSPNGKQLATGSRDCTVQIFDLESGKNRILERQSHVVTSVAFSPDGGQLATGSVDEKICIFYLESRKKHVIEGHSCKILSIRYSPDGRQLVSGSSDGTVRIWNLKNGESHVLEGHSDNVLSVAYSPNGKQLASSSYDGTVRIWDLNSGESRLVENHLRMAFSISYSPDGKSLAISSGRTIRIHDIESGKNRILKVKSFRPVNTVAFSPDGKYLVYGTIDNMVVIWDLESDEHRTLSGPVGFRQEVHVAYSPNGKQLAAGIAGGKICIWDLQSGERYVLEEKGNSIRKVHVAYSPDGKQLVSCSEGGPVRIWDLQSGKSHTLETVSRVNKCVMYCPDGKQLAIGSSDGTIRIWDLKSSSVINRFYIIRDINLSGANFELSIIDEEDKKMFKMAGAKV